MNISSKICKLLLFPPVLFLIDFWFIIMVQVHARLFFERFNVFYILSTEFPHYHLIGVHVVSKIIPLRCFRHRYSVRFASAKSIAALNYLQAFRVLYLSPPDTVSNPTDLFYSTTTHQQYLSTTCLHRKHLFRPTGNGTRA